jgi:4-amino-4-deoxy-L-arabinose transferase-like glycosyltransferase
MGEFMRGGILPEARRRVRCALVVKQAPDTVRGLALAGVLVLCLVPMAVGIGRRGPRHTMEAMTLHSAQETWLRQQSGESGAWLAPTRNGQLRVRKPPLVVWTDMLAWSGLDRGTAGVDTLIRRARLTTIGLALVMVAATGWIALGTLGAGRGRDLALVATGVAGTFLLTQQQARLASYDMHLAAWVTLAVACAFSAIRHAGAKRWTAMRWVGAGLALALAWGAKGPIALLFFLVPVTVAAALAGRPLRRGVGVATAVVIAGGLLAPWYVHLGTNHPEALEILQHEYRASFTNAQPAYHYPLQLLTLLMPWTLWIIGGLCLPFLGPRPGGAAGRRAWIAWIWFVGLVFILSVPSGKAARYILPIVPAAALLAASVIEHHLHLARARRRDGTAWRVAGPHWVVLGALALAPAGLALGRAALAERGWIDADAAAPGVVAGIATTVALLLVVAAGVRASVRFRPGRVALATGAWMVIASAMLWHLDASTSTVVETFPTAAAAVAEHADGRRLRVLYESEDDAMRHAFLLYAREVIPTITPRRLRRDAARGRPLPAVLARDGEELGTALDALGFTPAYTFREDDHVERTLWLP